MMPIDHTLRRDIDDLKRRLAALEVQSRLAVSSGTTGSIADTASEAIFGTAASQAHLVYAVANNGTTNYVLSAVFCESDGGTNTATIAGSASGITITNSGTSIRVTNNSGGALTFTWSQVRIK